MLATYLIIFLLATLYSSDRGNADPQLLGNILRFDQLNARLQQRDQVGTEIYCANKCSMIEDGICPLCPNIANK
ncbi:unnamed protein product [Gordionus sp. m RMFG-2023]